MIMKALGIGMLAAPFVALFVYAGIRIGWIDAIAMFGIVVALCAWISLALLVYDGG